MDVQSQVNADVAILTAAVTGISADIAPVAAFIKSLQDQVAAGQTPDLSGLDAVAAQAQAAKTALDALVPAPPAPSAAPVSAPAAA